LEDLIDIFQSKSHLLSALSDVYYLFDFAMQEMKKGTFPSLLFSKLFKTNTKSAFDIVFLFTALRKKGQNQSNSFEKIGTK
jgi:hypothetical protein